MDSVLAAEMPWPCELIVVVDGGTDGTDEALSTLTPAIPLTVIRQDNLGAARARNRGALAASGRYLLFLDDDMSIDRRLMVEHEQTMSAGADAVVGDIGLHPDSPATLLAQGVARWGRQRRDRLARAGGQLTVADFLTGQLSVRADAFARVDGFDEELTAGGSFGGEDTDFILRLLQAGARVRYNAAAVSHQQYIVGPAQNLRQWQQAGGADAALSRKHPGLGAVLWRQHRGGTLTGRLARLASAVHPRLLQIPRSWVVRRVAAGHTDRPTEWAFTGIRDVAYWTGARSGGGIVPDRRSSARILAYHAVDRIDDPLVGPYTVDPRSFREQLDALLTAGYTFIDADRLVAHLDAGTPLPDRGVLLTFDDGYGSLLTHAVPVLDRLGIPAVVCVVTSQLGGHNAWDEARGAAKLPLLAAEQLRALSRAGWEIAAHSHSHAHLTTLPAPALIDELCRPRTVLSDAGLPEPRLVAYPHGEQDLRVRRFARQAGYTAGLALQGGGTSLADADRYALPRVEVRRGMGTEELLRLLAESRRARPWRGRGLPARTMGGLRALVRSAMDTGQPAGGRRRRSRRAPAAPVDQRTAG